MPKYQRTLINAAVFIPVLCAWAAADPLGRYLVSDDPQVRTQAISQFQRLSPKEKQAFVPDLMMATDDADPNVSQDASRLLEEMGVGAKPSTEMLQKQMAGDRDALDHRAQFDELREELAQDKDQDFDAAQMAGSAPQSLVLEALKDPDPLIHSHAARQLSSIHPVPVQAIPILVEMLRAKDAESRGAAAAALGSMGPAAAPALPALLKSMGDADPDNRQILAEAIRQIQDNH